jgi:hypothetical protein
MAKAKEISLNLGHKDPKRLRREFMMRFYKLVQDKGAIVEIATPFFDDEVARFSVYPHYWDGKLAISPIFTVSFFQNGQACFHSAPFQAGERMTWSAAARTVVGVTKLYLTDEISRIEYDVKPTHEALLAVRRRHLRAVGPRRRRKAVR